MTLSLTVEDGAETALELVSPPDKLEYSVGETLDMTGLKVLIYENGKTVESLNGDKLTYSTKPLETLSERKIQLTYKDAMEIFYVTVKEAPEEPRTEATEPDQTEPITTQPGTEKPTDPTEVPTEPMQTATPDEPITPEKNKGMPWWGILLIAMAAAGGGCAATFLILKKKKAV
jgi:hypothetical protein